MQREHDAVPAAKPIVDVIERDERRDRQREQPDLERCARDQLPLRREVVVRFARGCRTRDSDAGASNVSGVMTQHIKDAEAGLSALIRQWKMSRRAAPTAGYSDTAHRPLSVGEWPIFDSFYWR